MLTIGPPGPFPTLDEPTPVPGVRHERILSVAVDGEQSAVFAASKRRIWSFGTQQNGTLGNGTSDTASYEPRVMIDLDDIAIISTQKTWHLNVGAFCLWESDMERRSESRPAVYMGTQSLGGRS